MTKLIALFLISLITSPYITAEPLSFSINTKKWSHVLDDHFISISVNPTDLLQGRVYGLTMNSTLAILKGLAPAYVRIGSADTAKYTFKRNRYPSDMIKPEDEYTVTETHWMVFNEVAHSAGLDVIVCLNAAHRIEGTKKWDTRNSLELISFSDSQGYNLTWQLGYEVQSGEELSGTQFGKDLNRLRTILNAFPRYQHSKLIGPDIRVIHKKEDIDFWNDMLIEAGSTLDAVTWHPRWPQPSKMKVSDNSDLGYEFPMDYLEWDRNQLNKILQRSIFKNPVWIGETKRESTGTFAEGLIWARRLILAAKTGIEVVMKQPNLMDITHPKPEYWIALLHKRLLGKSVLETRSVTNNTDVAVISHCTNPTYWNDKPEKLQDGPITVYGVNMGGLEQKIQIKGNLNGKSQLLFQYVLTSGTDPDSVFSQVTYLNGEPILMTDDGMLPDIIPKIKKLERGLTMKLPPYSVGFWVVPEAKVKICQVQPRNIPTISIETTGPSISHKTSPNNLENIRDINQFMVDKLTNPVGESKETHEMKIEPVSSESSEKDLTLLSKESAFPRVARRIRQTKPLDEINRELKSIMKETQDLLTKPGELEKFNLKMKKPKGVPAMEHRVHTIAEGISDAIKGTNQQHEFDKFLEDSGLKQDFGQLMVNERRFNAPGMNNLHGMSSNVYNHGLGARFKRSLAESEYSEEGSSEEDDFDMDSSRDKLFDKKITVKEDADSSKAKIFDKNMKKVREDEFDMDPSEAKYFGNKMIHIKGKDSDMESKVKSFDKKTTWTKEDSDMDSSRGNFSGKKMTRNQEKHSEMDSKSKYSEKKFRNDKDEEYDVDPIKTRYFEKRKMNDKPENSETDSSRARFSGKKTTRDQKRDSDEDSKSKYSDEKFRNVNEDDYNTNPLEKRHFDKRRKNNKEEDSEMDSSRAKFSDKKTTRDQKRDSDEDLRAKYSDEKLRNVKEDEYNADPIRKRYFDKRIMNEKEEDLEMDSSRARFSDKKTTHDQKRDSDEDSRAKYSDEKFRNVKEDEYNVNPIKDRYFDKRRMNDKEEDLEMDSSRAKFSGKKMKNVKEDEPDVESLKNTFFEKKVTQEDSDMDYLKTKPFGKKITLAKEDEEKKNKKQDLIIPHNPDLKGLEEKYKSIIQIKLQDEKRKIDDIKRKLKQEEPEVNPKKKSPEGKSDIREEIIKKEIELIEKTEETVADILKTQKKRQETFGDIIFDELNDVKEERISALEEIQKKKANTIVKRNSQTPLSEPILKTVEYIEKNFNLEPESVKKIKRSLEEKMGEILRNYDVKKSLETRKRLSTKDDKKIITRKPYKDDDKNKDESNSETKQSYAENSERSDDTKSYHINKDRVKDKTVVRKPTVSTSKSTHPSLRSFKKHDTDGSNSKEQSKGKKNEDRRKGDEGVNESYETSAETKSELRKSDRRRSYSEEPVEKNLRYTKKDSENIEKEETKKTRTDSDVRRKTKDKSYEIKKRELEEEKKETESLVKEIPLKNDKQRRENMLKHITSMIENMNSMEETGDRLKRMDLDDVSEEFTTNNRMGRINRRPRKAEVSDFVPETNPSDEKKQIPDENVTSQPPGIKSKFKKLRIRPSRKLKTSKPKEGDEIQRKRHLNNLSRSMDPEKKKLTKPKAVKLHTKIRIGNELPLNEKDKLETDAKNSIAQIDNSETGQNAQMTIQNEKPDEMADKNPDMSKKTQTDFLEAKKEADTNFPDESVTPTEGYIIVEPTVETGKNEKATTDRSITETVKETNKNSEGKSEVPDKSSEPEKPKNNTVEDKDKSETPNKLSESEQSKTEETDKDKTEEKEKLSEPEQPMPAFLEYKSDDKDEVSAFERPVGETSEEKLKETKKLQKTAEKITEKSNSAVREKNSSEEKETKNDEELQSMEGSSNEYTEMKSEKKISQSSEGSSLEDSLNNEPMPELMKESNELADSEVQKTQRKRRATFLPNHGEEDDEDDYSSEERIKKFKQMINKKSPAKKPYHNEVRSNGVFGADELLRMAGSTVRVMFDDVIPEAYGQTKTKIQNMGISQYIKEFGKIVQQMKNLDQIFLNIGEAAVKGYIRGNRAEKGPYIQVISRKRRSLDDTEVINNSDSFEGEMSTGMVMPVETEQIEGAVTENDNGDLNDEKKKNYPVWASPEGLLLTTTGVTQTSESKPEGGSQEYATTSTGETWVVDKQLDDGSPVIPEEFGKSTERTIEKKEQETDEKTPQTEILISPKNEENTKTDEQLTDSKINTNELKKLKKKYSKQNSSQLMKDKVENGDNGVVTNTNLKEELQGKISPWLKTTKDFIQQALTTLRRQKELSEIITRETLNDLISKDPLPKVVGKRETVTDEPTLPVRHVAPQRKNKKRETYSKHTEESLMRHLKGLQPGVYVVPTEEMTNIRSEQITNEAKQKSGLPNVVTLNIYYDKKNQDGSTKSDVGDTAVEPIVTYYQNKAWNAAAAQYDQNQFVSPVQDMNVPAAVLAPVPVAPALQAAPVYSPDPKLADLPNSRLIQYPTPSYYTPTQKVYPSILTRNPQAPYNPFYYVQPETRFIPQPPGTKRQWYEFKARNSGLQTGAPGWNLQYETIPGSLRVPTKNSLSKNYKIFSDRKRSVADPHSSDKALPFWNFFATSEKKPEKMKEKTSKKVESESMENESLEDASEDNRKRDIEEEKAAKEDSAEATTEEIPTENEKSRKKRSMTDTKENILPGIRKMVKRSYPYDVEFKDHDILPEWFGTYHEIENTLEDLSPHIRRSHIVSAPWTDEDEELLSILEADDELTLADLDNDDYYYGNGNSIGQLRRYRRSTDQSESSMLKTNMIYKNPMENEIFKSKVSKSGMKKLGDEDSSLELITKSILSDGKMPSSGIKPNPQQPNEQYQQYQQYQQRMMFLTTTPTPSPQQPQQPQPQQPQQPLNNQSQLSPNGLPLPRNPNEEPLYYFFKYAYDSFVKVMKSMTQLL